MQYRKYFARVIVIALLAIAPATEASIEKAKLLYNALFLDDAKRELIDTISSDATDDEKAEALHLLGTIAVDEKRYDAALKTWTELIARYPSTTAAKEADGKLPLVRLLVEQSAEPALAEHGSTSSGAALRGVVVTGAVPRLVTWSKRSMK